MKTKTRFHKLTAWLLTLAMLMTFIPSFTLTASAATEVYASGNLGQGNRTAWTIYDNGLLVIDGKGNSISAKWDSTTASPWKDYADIITRASFVNCENWVRIPENTFRGLSNLKEVILPENIEEICQYAFTGAALETIILPERLETIGNYAFSSCESLNYININDGVTSIGSSAFYNCSSLKAISIPDSVTSIGQTLFQNCGNLEYVRLSESLDKVGGSMFLGCTMLKNVSLPASVTVIGPKAFSNASNLAGVYYHGTVEPTTYNPGLNNASFSLTPDTMVIYASNDYSGTTMGLKATWENDVHNVTKIDGYFVNVAHTIGGAVKVDKSIVPAGDTVTVDIMAYKNYVLDTFAVTGADGNEITVTGDSNTRTFSMPEGDVTITATFKSTRVPHVHSWTFEAEGTYINATCANTDGACHNPYQSVVITPPSTKYFAWNLERTVTVSGTIEDVEIPEVVYTLKSTGEEVRPFEPGVYVASLTIENTTLTYEYEITKSNQLNNSFFTYTAPENLTYDGTAKIATVVPNATVDAYIGDVEVLYNRSSTPPVTVGTYTVTLNVEESDYFTAKTNLALGGRGGQKFSIVAKDIEDLDYTGLAASYPVGATPDVTIQYNGMTLEKDTDYTLEYANNTVPGTATITITGIGNYTGTKTLEFEISAHEHSWNYELDGTDTIKATCTAEGCTDTNGGSVTIAAPASLDYTGEAIEAVVTNNLTTGDTVEVVYTAISGSELTEGKPVKVGTYTAKITIGGVTASVDFEITPVTYTVTVSNTIENGTVVADVSEAEEGDTVTLTVTPNEGFVLGAVSYYEGTNDIEITATDGVYSFTMPANEVMINAIFVEVHSVLTPRYAGYTINRTADTVLPIKHGDSYAFTVEITDGYEKTAEFAVKAGNREDDASALTALTPDENGVYTITNITSDKKIQVVGVSPCKPDSIDDFKADGNAPFKLVCEADESHSITAPYFDSAYVTVGDINATTRLCEITYNVGKYLEDKLPGHRAEGYIPNYITVQLRWDEEASKWAYASATRELTVTCAPETYDIRIASNSKGTVTSDKTEAAEGETVTITLTPAEGYAPGTVRVEDESGEDVPVTNSTFTMPACFVTVYATFVKSSTEVQFEVVKEINDWNAEGSFTFKLQTVTEGAPMPTNASAVATEDTPSVSFGTIVYDEIGTYEYTITEVQGSMLGMSYDPTPHTVIVTVTQGADYKLSATVTYDGEDQLIITNTYTPMHSVRISAVDIDEGFELEGATLQILDENGSIIDEWVSTKEPHAVEALRVNETYTIQAAAAPSGYKKCSGMTFRMDATHGLVTYGSVTEDGVLLVEFAPVGFIIEAERRFDIETRENILFEICDAENAVVASRSLAEFDDWAWKVIGLPMGNDYTVRVTNAPWGYANPADISVSIDRDGNVTINDTPSADGVIFVTFEEISPAIHEIVFNSDSDAYDAETNTFYYDSQHLPRIVINGQDLLGQKIYLGLENSDGNHLGFYDIAEDDTGIFMPLNKAILDETFDIFALEGRTADIVKIRAEITGSPDAPTYLELNIKPKKYSITLDSNGANIEPVTLETDYRKLTALPTPERSGYTFNGWFDAQIGGNEITTDTVFTQDTTIYAQWTKLIPKITGIAVDVTSPAYDAATDTFTVAKDKPFVVVLSGEHFVNIDDEFLEANAFGFVPSVDDPENAFGNALQVLKEAGLATIDAEDNRIKLTFDYDTMKAFVVEHGGLEGIYYGDIANIQEENIASVNIAFTKYDPVYTEPTVKTGLVYNGAEQELLIPGTAEGGTMKYYIGGTAATAEVPTRKAAGEYTVTCIIAGDSFHNNIVVGEYTVAIAKKTINSAIVLTAPVKNTAPQTEIAGSGYTATVDWSPEVTDKFGYRTEYTATVTITPDENHTVAGIVANGYTVEGAKTVTNDENSNVVTVAYEETGSRPSSGGGGSSSNTTTTTTKNEDGSTTKVTENKTTGTKKEVTTNTDGSTTTVETKKDGTVSTTEKDKDGNTVTTVEKSDGTSTTTEKNKDGSEKVTEKSADGTTVTTEKDTDGTKTVTTEKADGSTTTEVVRKDGTEVKTETTTDGETTSEVKADGKSEVTIPVPDTEKVQMVVVTDENGNNTYITEIETNDNGVAVTTDGNATVSVMSGNKKEFVDVHHVDHWSEKSVDFVHILGLMNGTSENHFSPDVDLTRAMLVTVLYRAEGEPEMKNAQWFEDVEKGQWYSDAVAWATFNGITMGYGNGNFGPNDNITREQIVAIMHRYAQYKGYDVTQGGMLIREYSDYENISDYALNAMTWSVNIGMLSGRGNNNLAPQSYATRAEVATILERFIKAN